MTGVKRTAEDLPGWTFDIDEVSAGVYKVRGVDEAGHTVEATGTDPDALFEESKRSAARIRDAVRSRHQT